MCEQLKQPSYTIIKTLKIDMFGTIFLANYQDQTVIVRDFNLKNKWLKMIAKYLNHNEIRILREINQLNSPNFPKLIESRTNCTIRSYISGKTINQYPEKLNKTFYNKAFELLETLHQNGIVHNDLEKAENWIVMDNGEPAFIDFQLAKYYSRETHLFKLLKKVENRHIIKSKNRFCNSPLTTYELNILNNRSFIHILVRQFIKPIYNFITRKLLNYSDRKSEKYDVN